MRANGSRMMRPNTLIIKAFLKIKKRVKWRFAVTALKDKASCIALAHVRDRAIHILILLPGRSHDHPGQFFCFFKARLYKGFNCF